MSGQATRIEVLGESRMICNGVGHPIPEDRQGFLLRLLLLHPNEPVPYADLVSQLWPDAGMDMGIKRLRVAVTRLRSLLGQGITVEADDGAYRLVAPTGSIDVLELQSLVPQAESGNVAAARDALRLWRGEPYAGFPGSRALDNRRRQLTALHARLEEIAAGLGQHSVSTCEPQPRRAASGVTMISRPRLLDRLPAVGAARLIALTAPVGYGKSVLLTQWAEREGARVACRSFKGTDGDATALRHRLVTAFGEAGERVGLGELPTGAAPGWPAHLINRLFEVDEPLGLVLDDLHHITSPAVISDLQELLQHGPPHLTLAVASCRSLPFPTARLRANADMLALGPSDLAMTPDEVVSLAVTGEQAGRNQAKDWELASRLHAMTGGWPEAVMTLVTAIGSNVDDLDLRAANPPAADVVDRALSDLPPELVKFMIDTAHIAPLTADVCDVVSGRTDTAQLLQQLESRHHQLTKVGDSYRRQPLLTAVLRHRQACLEGGRVRLSHARAGRWYLDNSQPEAALTHAAAADDAALVSASLGPAVWTAAARADGRLLRRWTANVRLPAHALNGRGQGATALLAAALLPRRHRHGWAPTRCSGTDGGCAAVVEAVDLHREGRCTESLDAIERARLLLDRRSPTADLAGMVLAMTESGNLLLLDGASQPQPSHDLLGGLAAAPWPWLTLWAFGQRALQAYVMGDPVMAEALLRHAEARCDEIHRSWSLAADGSSRLVRCLIDSDHARSRSGQITIVDTLRNVACHVEDGQSTPMATIARYALQLANRRAGNEKAAATALAEADAALSVHRQLPFLQTVRTRLCDAPSVPPAKGLDDLSLGELAVLDCLDSDLTLAEIASKLFLSAHTVKAHTRSIYRKLGVRRRSQAVASAHAL